MRTIVILLFTLGSGLSYVFPQKPESAIVVGAEQMSSYLPLLAGKQVALVVNHSSRVGNTHLADTLHSAGICISRIFAPEHGFRGDAPDGEHMKDGMDQQTGAPITSLYGKKRRPDADDLAGTDFVIFDIQDVGTRFYTYISTLFYILDACAEYRVPVMVLDRPNPNGHFVDGPVLDMRLRSFVGIAPLPIVHGCTVGELARLFVGEYWCSPVQPDLRVIPCRNYTHNTQYAPPLAPSPNLPNYRAVLLYPSICLFEGTEVSIGRGTDWPFQVAGHPDYPDSTAFSFTPMPNSGSRYPPMEGRLCRGWDFRDISTDSLFLQKQINLKPLLAFYQILPNKAQFFLPTKYFNRLAGSYSLWQQLEAGKSEEEIRASWQEDLEAFRAIRKQYLIYPE